MLGLLGENLLQSIKDKLIAHLSLELSDEVDIAFSGFYAKCTGPEEDALHRMRNIFGEDAVAIWLEEVAVETGLWEYNADRTMIVRARRHQHIARG